MLLSDLRYTGLIRPVLELQCQRLQAQQNIVLRMIAEAGWFVRNDVITRDLKIETLEEFINMLARRTFNRADAGPYTALHNLAPQCKRPPRGYQLSQYLFSYFTSISFVYFSSPALPDQPNFTSDYEMEVNTNPNRESAKRPSESPSSEKFVGQRF
ncbi:hypothetical protein EVAR_36202_1 [Eumeta japonica]|uniref:Uncharacterized protein n=1 Tax=Eumeta variegata TaxID=151549 RepID=A0A4C1VQP0_EUMVA|nr:hypothetical protein EVAR_36202_1 [Eumeta japonica]